MTTLELKHRSDGDWRPSHARCVACGAAWPCEAGVVQGELDALQVRVNALRAALAHYARRKTWEDVDEFDVRGWLYTGDDLPWTVARAAVGGGRPGGAG